MIASPELLMALVEPFLARQGWFEAATAGQPEAPIELFAFDVLLEDTPGLGRLILRRGEQAFQLLVGWRNPADLSGALRRREAALLGSLGSGTSQLVIYEALADDALCQRLLEMTTNGAVHTSRVRSVSSLTSHAALVFDDRLFMKCYRVLESGERNEVVTTMRLDDVGFNALASPVGVLRAHGYDLAFVREFLPSALEGRALALTSLRDLLAYSSDDEAPPPGTRSVGTRRRFRDPDEAAASAGGDLASETFRLGQTIARMHLASRDAFGDFAIDLAALLGARFDGEHGLEMPASSWIELGGPLDELFATIDRAKDGDLGHAIRLHGELQLRRVMRSEAGWIVAGFSDDPLYRRGGNASSVPPRVGLPVEDLADMFFSIEFVAKEALSQRPSANELRAAELARAWTRRNQRSFLRGYFATPGANALLPAEQLVTEALLVGYRIVRQRRYDATFSDSSP